jgi:rRNA-processing protein EBP2
MAKKRNSPKKKQKTPTPKEEERITLEALDAMSSSDEEGMPEGQLNTKAKSLRQAIMDGKFDHLIGKLKENADDDDGEIEEVALDSDGDEDDDEEEKHNDNTEEIPENEEGEAEDSEVEEEGDIENEESSNDEADNKIKDKTVLDDENDEEEVDEEEDEELDKTRQLVKNNHANSKALKVVTAELVASHARLPWSETFDVVPPAPLPFGKKKGDEEDEAVDIHDDLKREVAFYNTALEAVNEARRRCKTSNIPFARPEDFFAEMVKTDGMSNYAFLWILVFSPPHILAFS